MVRVYTCVVLYLGHPMFYTNHKTSSEQLESEFVHFGPITNEGQISLGATKVATLLSVMVIRTEWSPIFGP